MPWSCTADVLGKNLLQNVYFAAQGWEQKATGGAGAASPHQVVPALDLPFRTRTPGKHSGVRRGFSEPAALWRGQGQWRGDHQGRFHRFPGLVWDPFPSVGWWAVGLGAAKMKSENWRELMGALGAVERREVPLQGQRARWPRAQRLAS